MTSSKDGQDRRESDQTHERIALTAMLALFFALSLFSARHKSITIDEAKHYDYGLRILTLNSDRLNSGGTIVDDSKMPFTAINALPAKLSPFLPDGWLKRFSATIQAGRPATILFATLAAFVMFHWAKRLYGSLAALFALFLYTFEPSIIAHSHFVTTDIYAMGTMLFAVYSLWHFNQRPTFGRLFLVAILLGVSQLSKYTSVFLVPLMIIMQLVHDSPTIWGWLQSRDSPAILVYLRNWLLAGAFTTATALLIINAAYFFNGSMTAFGDYGFKSRILHGIQVKLPFIDRVPVPLPYPYLQGLDLVRYRDELGFGYGKILLMGHLSPQGFPGYYFVDMVLKTPLPMIMVFLLGIACLVWRRPSVKSILEQESFLLIPVVWFLFYMNYLLRAQLGIRLILVIFPFLFILAGNLVRDLTLRASWRVAVTGVLSLWLVVSVLRFYPHFLPYSSELIWDKRMAYAYLANGEFDWGQSQRYLEDWLREHPSAIVDPTEPVSGTIVMTPKLLAGTPRYNNTSKYAWLRDNFRPVDVIAYTYPVFRVTPQDLARLSLDESAP